MQNKEVYYVSALGRVLIENVISAIKVLEENGFKVDAMQESEPHDLIVLRAIYDCPSDEEQLDCLILDESEIEEGIKQCLENKLILVEKNDEEIPLVKLVIMDYNDVKVYTYDLPDIIDELKESNILSSKEYHELEESEKIEAWISNISDHKLSQVDYMTSNNFELIEK